MTIIVVYFIGVLLSTMLISSWEGDVNKGVVGFSMLSWIAVFLYGIVRFTEWAESKKSE